MIEDYEDKTFACIEKLYADYPVEVYKKTIQKILKEKLKQYDQHIERVRAEYNRLASFKERKEFFENRLKIREQGYVLARQEALTHIENPHPQPYENWVNEYNYPEIQKLGYEEYLNRNYMLIL